MPPRLHVLISRILAGGILGFRNVDCCFHTFGWQSLLFCLFLIFRRPAQIKPHKMLSWFIRASHPPTALVCGCAVLFMFVVLFLVCFLSFFVVFRSVLIPSDFPLPRSCKTQLHCRFTPLFHSPGISTWSMCIGVSHACTASQCDLRDPGWENPGFPHCDFFALAPNGPSLWCFWLVLVCFQWMACSVYGTWQSFCVGVFSLGPAPFLVVCCFSYGETQIWLGNLRVAVVLRFVVWLWCTDLPFGAFGSLSLTLSLLTQL